MVKSLSNITVLSRTSVAAIALSLALYAAPSAAQETDTEERAAEETFDDYHNTIVVTAAGLDELDFLAGTSVLNNDQLLLNLDGQLGEVLSKLPGVSATSFAPGSSRPVLRGLQGERVKVLNDGVGAIDASNTSVDHAVSIDPLIAERIEVLRGPAALLYGSQAIGGAVNVIDKRIPRAKLEEPVHIDFLGSVDTAHDLREIGASVDLPLGSSLVFHLDGSYRESGNVEIAGFAVAPEFRAELLEEAAEEEEEGEFEEAEEFREAANQRGFVPNTGTETVSAGAGLAWFGDNFEMGASVSYYDTDYGIPGRPGAGHHHGEEGEEGEEEEGEEEEEIVAIGLEQVRIDFAGKYKFSGSFFEELRLRAGYSDYTHTEFEGDEVGTVFDVSGAEARAELVQSLKGGWSGSIGAQYLTRDFVAVGAEAYVAPNETRQFSLFTFQQIEGASVTVEGGLRWENTQVDSAPLATERSFDAFSAALSASTFVGEGLKLGLNGTRVERAPAAEELYANGPHIATQAFEIGDPNLGIESAVGLEAFLRGTVGPTTVSFAVYQNWFDDFIYLSETGLEEDELPVFQYLQQDADYFGIEGQVSFPLTKFGDNAIIADLRGDYIRATFADGTPVPRTPPLSLLGALEWQSSSFDARAEVEWFAEQDRIAAEETATDSFAFVNASVAWKPLANRENITLLFKVDNVLDVNGRRHASFTKDFVPLAGRNAKVTLRASF